MLKSISVAGTALGSASAQATEVAARRAELWALMGELPERTRAIGVERLGSEERSGFVLEKLVLDVNGMEPAPAYFVRPKNVKGRGPAILFNHWHGGEYELGKDEMLRPKEGIPSWAEAIAAEGWCVLCLDMWAFGGRATRSEADIFKEMLWRGRVMWGMMVFDTLRGLDYLVDRPEVDASRVATVGMSMGSTMAWWAAALDERIKVCVDICCLTDFDALIEAGNLSGHGIYYYVPSLLQHFTTSQINALIAPRAHLGLAGNLDALTPPAGLDRIDRELKAVYAKAGKPERWKLFRQDVEHVETPEMRREALEFLRKHI
jgi:pimeloyl-ACP methyl ester carboxylesterase